jgi:hypothetical protein
MQKRERSQRLDPGGEVRCAWPTRGMDDLTLALCALVSARASLSAGAGELAAASVLAPSRRLANDAAILSGAIDAELGAVERANRTRMPVLTPLRFSDYARATRFRR